MWGDRLARPPGLDRPRLHRQARLHGGGRTLIDDERFAKLRSLGLPEYGARAYLALLDLGTTDARQASRLAKVPASKIYHVLDQLHERGLARVLPESPRRYEPVPFEEYLDRLRDEHARSIAAIEQERDALAELFRVHGSARVGDHGGLTLVRGRRGCLDKQGELLRATQGDLLVLGTLGMLARLRRFQDELAAARERGVRLRLMLPPDALALPQMRELAGLAEVRVRPREENVRSESVAILLSDARRAYLLDHVPDDASLHAGKDMGVHLTQEGMVARLASIAETLWEKASPVRGASVQAPSGQAATQGSDDASRAR